MRPQRRPPRVRRGLLVTAAAPSRPRGSTRPRARVWEPGPPPPTRAPCSPLRPRTALCAPPRPLHAPVSPRAPRTPLPPSATPRAPPSPPECPLPVPATPCVPLSPLSPPAPLRPGSAGRSLHPPGAQKRAGGCDLPRATAATSQPVIAKQTRLKYWIGLNRDKIYAFAANLFVQLYLKALD